MENPSLNSPRVQKKARDPYARVKELPVVDPANRQLFLSETLFKGSSSKENSRETFGRLATPFLLQKRNGDPPPLPT